ncbi:mCG1035341, isoform CRA_a [Mus musculus]|nr:mCG1035341, isoform CRA_a [Mus musculus]EDL26375.1 mCG1035341, isoform CRA_a [Mus musculus]
MPAALHVCTHVLLLVSTQEFIVEGISLTCCLSLIKKIYILTNPYIYMLPDLQSGLGYRHQSQCSQKWESRGVDQWGQPVTWTSYITPVPPKTPRTHWV